MKKLLLAIAPLLALSACTETLSAVGNNTLATALGQANSNIISQANTPYINSSMTAPITQSIQSSARNSMAPAMMGTNGYNQPRHTGNMQIGSPEVYDQHLRTCTPYTYNMGMAGYLRIHGVQNNRCVVETKSLYAHTLCHHSKESVAIQLSKDIDQIRSDRSTALLAQECRPM